MKYKIDFSLPRPSDECIMALNKLNLFDLMIKHSSVEALIFQITNSDIYCNLCNKIKTKSHSIIEGHLYYNLCGKSFKGVEVRKNNSDHSCGVTPKRCNKCYLWLGANYSVHIEDHKNPRSLINNTYRIIN
jgi:hypothetical protein